MFSFCNVTFCNAKHFVMGDVYVLKILHTERLTLFTFTYCDVTLCDVYIMLRYVM
jgi:hypothetical protein